MKSILVIYTGGTIGMVRDKVSGALVPLDFSQVSRHVPELAQAGIRVEAVSFDTPIDSSDVMPKHWRSLALTVAECHDRFDGFVGTNCSNPPCKYSVWFKHNTKTLVQSYEEASIAVGLVDGLKHFDNFTMFFSNDVFDYPASCKLPNHGNCFNSSSDAGKVRVIG